MQLFSINKTVTHCGSKNKLSPTSSMPSPRCRKTTDCKQPACLLFSGRRQKAAIPAVCDILVQEGNQGGIKRYEVMNTLVHLCGGPSAVASKLTTLMQSPEPAARAAAAGGAGLCDDIGFQHIGGIPAGAYHLYPAQNSLEIIKFRARVLPALSSRLDDPVTAVKLAALKSLEALTYPSGNVGEIVWQEAFTPSRQKAFDMAWKNTLPPLARAVASPDPAVRLASYESARIYAGRYFHINSCFTS